VAEGRKLTPNQVDSIAQGRVWSGTDAKRIGLVDEFGGLNKAIQIAAKKANLTEYRLSQFPEQKEPFEQFMESLGEETSAYIGKQKFGEHYEWYNQISKLLKYEGMQMRMPTTIEIN
jgi:protease-4